MGKKRKVSGRAATKDTVEGWNENGGKLGPIRTYEDVADSEDEFHINRDKVMLDDGPDAKRRRKWQDEDAILEPSDEEVLAYSSASDEDEDEDEDGDIQEHDRAHQINGDAVGSSDVEEAETEEYTDGWGGRKEHYTTDTIETEHDAKLQEEEVLRTQRQRLAKMSKEDFGFDEDEWRDTAEDDGKEGDTITEALKDFEVTSDMGPKERGRILITHYPEFDFLADEFISLQPTFQVLQQQLGAESVIENIKNDMISTTVVKCRALAAYMASLAMYLTLFSSTAKISDSAKPMDPAELHDHPVMDSIMKCREVWAKVKFLKAPLQLEQIIEESTLEPVPALIHVNGSVDSVSKKSKKQKALEIANKDSAAKRAAKIEAAEEELADLSSLISKTRNFSNNAQPVVFRDDNSDFGEETHLSTRAAAEKAQKKKSLRFYTSQIAQKSNRRAGAGRDAGGDIDVPYKERLKDRQARLNAEAEKRGKKLDEYGRGADLGGHSDDEDVNAANDVRGEEDEYYDMVAQSNKKRKMDKEIKYDAIKKAKAENAIVRVVEGEVDEDGKRAIGYVIEKNKGLAPKRKKDVRNPRVKKRKKYEEKKKKLGSTRAVYKGGEERGGYGGEKTGIKTGLVKSVKL